MYIRLTALYHKTFPIVAAAAVEAIALLVLGSCAVLGAVVYLLKKTGFFI